MKDKSESATKKITSPLSKAQAKSLRAGERVLLSGDVLLARDAAHKRISDSMESGTGVPFEIEGATIFYAGPVPAAEGEVIGPIGPTTSGRMDPYTPLLLKAGLRAMIGKGKRSPEVLEAIREHGAVYLGAAGGTSVLLAECVKSVESVAYEDLGPEAVKKLTVEDMPLVVLADCEGGDLLESGPAEARELIKSGSNTKK